MHACMSVYHMTNWCAQNSEEAVRFPGTGVMGQANHYVHAGNRTLVLSLQKQQMLLTIEPSLWASILYSFIFLAPRFVFLYFSFFQDRSFGAYSRTSSCRPGWP